MAEKSSGVNWKQGGAIAIVAALLSTFGVSLTDSGDSGLTQEQVQDIVDSGNFLTQEDLDASLTEHFGEEGIVTNEELLAELNEDKLWEDEAIRLAWDDISNRDVYKFLEVEKEDFDKWAERDDDVLRSDADDRDATVWLKLRAYYYDEETEDDERETIYALVTIEDGEVDDVEFSLEDDFE